MRPPPLSYSVPCYLEQQGAYEWLLFMDYRTTFNIILPSRLFSKMFNLGVQHNCCVSIQGLHPLEATFVGRIVSNLKAPPNAAHKCGLLFPLFGGYTATILCGLTYPKILCMPKKEEKKERNWQHRLA